VTGLIHISALSDEYVRRVTDVVKSGDRVTVEVMNIDDRGRYKLRRIVPEEERQEPQAEPTEAPAEAEAEEAEPKVEATAPPPSPREEEDEEAAPPEFEDRW
jgi:predicted RNA-binding protein with RPS1 domain